MGARQELRKVAREIVDQAKKMNVESEEGLSQITKDTLEQYSLNRMEMRIVRSYVEDMMWGKSLCTPKPSDR